MTTLPLHGTPREKVLDLLRESQLQDTQWKQGKTWSLVYHVNSEHTEFLKEAYSSYFHHNSLDVTAFPSLKRYERDLVSITAQLLGGNETSVGALTSGGSESIFLALKAYRDFYAAEKGISQPEMIAPESIHPAFDKAAQILGIKLFKAELDSDYRVNLESVRSLMSENTILLAGSAPSYPHGKIDPITELAALADNAGIGMHVDACLGGFFLPFAKKLGLDVSPFDLSVPGVTSMSADAHKYGFAAKGVSVVLYQDAALRRAQFFALTQWSGGLFASAGLLGTRGAGAVAAAWASFQALGEEGFLDLTQKVLVSTHSLKTRIQKLGFTIIGDDATPVFAFGSDEVNIFAVADFLSVQGWHINRQTGPNAIHLMVTPGHSEEAVDSFLRDLQNAKTHALATPQSAEVGMAGLYNALASGNLDSKEIEGFLIGHLESRFDLPSRA